MKYITEKGLRNIRDAVEQAYSENRETAELPAIPMLALLDDFEISDEIVTTLLGALETLLVMVVEGECNYDAQGQEWPEVKQARAAIAGARGE